LPADLCGPPVATFACTSPISDYCDERGCPNTLAEAEQDRQLCEPVPAREVTCAGYRVVTSGLDLRLRFYYRDDSEGQLVAVVRSGHTPKDSCLAGPASFDAPCCEVEAATLPACRTSER
jgi:hypothetical protein